MTSPFEDRRFPPMSLAMAERKPLLTKFKRTSALSITNDCSSRSLLITVGRGTKAILGLHDNSDDENVRAVTSCERKELLIYSAAQSSLGLENLFALK